MTKLGRNAFGKLPVVFELNLASNNLNSISARAFEGLLQVLVLNLTNNNLTFIPNGAFQGMRYFHIFLRARRGGFSALCVFLVFLCLVDYCRFVGKALCLYIILNNRLSGIRSKAPWKKI